MAKLLRRAVLDVAPLVVLAGAGLALLMGPSDKRRAGEPGRGRHARSPAEIPVRGWKDILLRTGKEFSEDEIPLIAAGVTFYTLLALFPGLGAVVALYGLFADVLTAQRHLQMFAFMLPPNTVEFIGEQMVRIASAGDGGLSLAFFSGLLASIWSANRAAKALIVGLNIAYEEEEKRGVVRKTLVSLAFTVGLIVFVLATFAVIALSPTIDSFAGRTVGMTFRLISWPLLPLGMVAGLALLYRFGPSRDPVRWSWISWGSAAAVVLWAAVSAGFSVYVGNFADYDAAYGPLGAVIGFMMWIWLSSLVILGGAELNAEIEHQTTVDTTVGAPKPMGLRRARMADTVGAAQGR